MANRTSVRTGNETRRSSRITDRDNLGRLRGSCLLTCPRLLLHRPGTVRPTRCPTHSGLVPRSVDTDESESPVRSGYSRDRGGTVCRHYRNADCCVDVIDGVRLLQDSSAWTSSDDAGLKDWMRAYLKWLLESSLGRDEATRGNNQETWYDAQVAALALYTGQPEVARKIIEAARASTSPGSSSRRLVSRANSHAHARGTTASST